MSPDDAPATMRRSRGRWRWHLALPRLALPRADRGVGLHHQSVRPALTLWLKHSPDGRLGSRERGRLRRAFNDFLRLTGSRREHCLFFFFKQKTAYEIDMWLEFRRVLFR